MKPTQELTEEHKKIKAMLRVLEGVATRLEAGEKVEVAKQYQKDGERGAKEFALNARDFVALLSQHIDKEDNILYLIADARIPEAKQEKLEEQFAQANARELSEEKRDGYQSLVSRLTEIYARA